MIVFAIMFLIVFAGMIIVGNLITKSGKRAKEAAKDNSWSKDNAEKTIKLGEHLKIFSVIPIAIILIVTLLFSIYIVDITEIGVVKTFGQIQRTVDGGLNFVNPFTDTVEMYDLRICKSEAQFMSYSKDAQPLTATVETQFKIVPSRVEEIAKEYGSQDVMEAKLSNIIEERAKIVFAKYSAMELIENRANLSAEVENEMTNVEEMFGIEFTSAIVRDIDFSDAFEQSVEAKMIASQEVLKAEQERQKAVIEAQKAKEVAEIQAEQARLTAQGEADALKITRDALAAMPETYIEQMWIEKWDGKLPTVTSDGTNLVFAPDLTN